MRCRKGIFPLISLVVFILGIPLASALPRIPPFVIETFKGLLEFVKTPFGIQVVFCLLCFLALQLGISKLLPKDSGGGSNAIKWVVPLVISLLASASIPVALIANLFQELIVLLALLGAIFLITKLKPLIDSLNRSGGPFGHIVLAILFAASGFFIFKLRAALQSSFRDMFGSGVGLYEILLYLGFGSFLAAAWNAVKLFGGVGGMSRVGNFGVKKVNWKDVPKLGRGHGGEKIPHIDKGKKLKGGLSGFRNNASKFGNAVVSRLAGMEKKIIADAEQRIEAEEAVAKDEKVLVEAGKREQRNAKDLVRKYHALVHVIQDFIQSKGAKHSIVDIEELLTMVIEDLKLIERLDEYAIADMRKIIGEGGVDQRLENIENQEQHFKRFIERSVNTIFSALQVVKNLPPAQQTTAKAASILNMALPEAQRGAAVAKRLKKLEDEKVREEKHDEKQEEKTIDREKKEVKKRVRKVQQAEKKEKQEERKIASEEAHAA